MKRKEIIEGWGKYGYDDFGYSLAPGHDEGEPVYNPRYDRVGGGPPRHKSPYAPSPRYPQSREPIAPSGQDEYHLKNTTTGKLLSKEGKPSVFSSERHARAVAAKLKFGNWEAVPAGKGVAEGSVDSKYPHGEVKYRIVYRKSGEKVEGVKSFASKADAQQYAAKDPEYSVQAYRVKQGVAEEIGHDQVSPKQARYILRLAQDHSIEQILDDFPELFRMMEAIAGERGLHLKDDWEDVVEILINDLEDIADSDIEDSRQDAEDSYDQDAIHYGMKEGDQEMTVDQLAAVSDEALDKAYGYGRSSPGNTFGWQANLKSAEFAKRAIESGITDIDEIADAIHDGWNVTARIFVKNPYKFDDTEKLKAAGKLEAKLAQREKLMNIGYAELPEEEKEKDRVVARALLQALGKSRDIDEEGDLTVKKVDPTTGKITATSAKDPTAEIEIDPKANAVKPNAAKPGSFTAKMTDPNQIKPGAKITPDMSTSEAVHRRQGANPMGQDELGSTHTQSTISGDEDHDEVTKLLTRRLRQLAGLE